MSCWSCKLSLSVALLAILTVFLMLVIGSGGAGAAAVAGAAEGGALVTALATKLGVSIAAAKGIVATLAGLIWAGATVSGLLGWICCNVLGVKSCC